MFMQIIVALLIVIGITFSVIGTDRENPWAIREARQELDKMRSFVLSLDRYVGSHTGFEGMLTWSGESGESGALALREQSTTPGSLRGIGMPAGWRAHVSAGGEYVLCARLSEAASALFTAELPAELQFGVVRLVSSAKDYVVLSSADDRKVASGATEPSTTAWASTCDQ